MHWLGLNVECASGRLTKGKTKGGEALAMLEQIIGNEEYAAERRMWTAVIVNAVEDWLSGPLRIRLAAQKFLFEDDDDFYQVCACAGIDPATFRSKLLRVGRRIELKRALPHPFAA